jgi:hypothetical protein
MRSVHTSRLALSVAATVLSGQLAAPASAAVSATIVPGSLTQGTTQASLTGGEYADESNKLHDWPLATGSFGGNTFAVSLSNANFNGNAFGGTPDSLVAFGNGGGVTLRFAQPLNEVPGQKEFGIFTAQQLDNSGGLFNGNMEAAILVSSDNVVWRTLTGDVVALPTTYTATSSKLNAPAMAYDYGTTSTAWSYGTPGTSSANLAALSVADFTTPMPDDNLFNGTGNNAGRAALKTDSTTATYDAVFGASGGGNWFDFSGSGLSQVQYVRLNGVNVGGGVRLDGAFANAAAVPEPAAVALLGVAGLALLRRGRRRLLAVPLAAALASLVGTTSAQAVTFDDVQYWVGSGSSRAAFVVDWNDAKPAESLVWGYRWNGSATGEDMLRAIVAADPRLFAHVGTAGGFGTPLWGTGYDLDNDGTFGVNPPLAFDAGGMSTGEGDASRTPTDAADHWREASFTTGFWSYYVGGSGNSPTWGFGDSGMTDRMLSNNAWDGWSFVADFANDPGAPSEPVAAAVPEPVAASLLGLASLAVLGRRRRRTA